MQKIEVTMGHQKSNIYTFRISRKSTIGKHIISGTQIAEKTGTGNTICICICIYQGVSTSGYYGPVKNINHNIFE